MDEQLRNNGRSPDSREPAATAMHEALRRRSDGTLTATRELLDRTRKSDSNYRRIEALGRVVARYGGLYDLRAVVDAFLEDPSRGALLRPIRGLGDRSVGEELWTRCCGHEGALLEGADADVLNTVGYLGVEAAQPALVQLALQPLDSGLDYDAREAAAFGLMNLPCTGFEREIAAAIRRCDSSNVFPEMIPALAAKTRDPGMLQEIYELGQNVSSSLNSGIILGLALYGELGRAPFMAALLDPAWGAVDRSTGTAYCTYQAARLLEVRMIDIYEELTVRRRTGSPGPRELRHGARVLNELLELRLESREAFFRESPPEEPLAAILQSLFDPGCDLSDDASITQALKELHNDGRTYMFAFTARKRELEHRSVVEAELEQLRLLLGISPAATS